MLLGRAATGATVARLFPSSLEQITALSDAAKRSATAALDQLYAQAPETATFDNVARFTDLTIANFSAAVSILSVGKNVYVEKEMRDAATKAMVDLQAFYTDNFSSNRKIYTAYKGIRDNATASGVASLDEERKYWFEEALTSFRRQGLDLEDDKLQVVVSLQKKYAELSSRFQGNIAEDSTTLLFSAAELEGVPADAVSSLKKKSAEEAGGVEKYVCGLDYPTYFAIVKNCTVAATRKAMVEAFDKRGFPVNMEVLNEVVVVRAELARILGYPSYAAYDLEQKMVKKPEVARDFVDKLIPGLQRKWAKEKEHLLRDPHPSVVLAPNGDIQAYDIAFLMNEYKKKHLNVDERKIGEYFPLDATVDALFRIYESFFAIKFQKIAPVSGFWHESVSLLAVIDDAEATRGQLLGHIVLDLFPRAGKFSHACCHGVLPAATADAQSTRLGGVAGDVEAPDAAFFPALAVVLANFPTATDGKPALFMHDDVETFFHEFGHAIHGLFGRSKMATHAGTRVKMDFVELPSQMLEEWLWEPSILNLITQHYVTKEKLPAELIAAKVHSKNAFSGRDSLRQLQFATFSLDIYSEAFCGPETKASDLDTTSLFQNMLPRVMPGIAYNAESRFQCSFGHLMGYGSGYYGYMWSDVLAQDVFEYIREHDGLLSATLGRRYVDFVIGRGGGRDPNDMLKDFLGREPNGDAFVRKLGL